MPAMPRPTFTIVGPPFLLDGPGRTAAIQVDQAALRRYEPRPGRPQPRVLVELRSTEGGRGVEVWLDRRPVGRLGQAAGQRYGPVVADLQRRGETPGCTADITRGGHGVGIELRLTDLPPPLSRPAPGHARALRPVLAGVGVVAVLLGITSLLGRGDDDRTAAASALAVPAVVTGPARATAEAISIVEPPTSSVAAPPSVIAPPVTTTVSARRTSVGPTTSPKPTAAKKTTPLPATAAAASKPPEPRTTASKPPPSPSPKPKPKPDSGCHPDYGGCVPIDTDVDCAGGSGNGPSYVSGPIRVTGSDVYGLDKDKDGIACE